MRNARILHPANEPLIIIREWQLYALDGNQCAAALLSLFEYWYTVKASNLEQNKKQSLLQWHTQEELEKGILNLYKRDSIRRAIFLLEEKGFISIKPNPNPRYGFDKTKYFLFNEEFTQKYISAYCQAKSFKTPVSEKSVTVSEKPAKSFKTPVSEKSVTVSEKSALQRLHAETTIGDYSFPSFDSKNQNSPLKRSIAHAHFESPEISAIPEETPETLKTRTPPTCAGRESTGHQGQFQCADNDSAQGVSFSSPIAESQDLHSTPALASGLRVVSEKPSMDSTGRVDFPDTAVSTDGSASSDCFSKNVLSSKTAELPLFEPELPQVAFSTAFPQPKSKPKKLVKSLETDPRAAHPAIAAVRDLTKRFPSKELWDEIIETIGDKPDFKKLADCYRELLKRGCNKNSWYWAIDWYRDGVPELPFNVKKQKEKIVYGKGGNLKDFGRKKPAF